jgi:hypothetical protein
MATEIKVASAPALAKPKRDLGSFLTSRQGEFSENCPIMPRGSYWDRKVSWQRYSRPLCLGCG